MNIPIGTAAYLAGVLDSDGYIGVHRNTYAMRVRGDTNGAVYQARIQVSQVEPGAVDLFRETFGGHRYLKGPSATRGRHLWTWQVHSAACRPVLESLLPYLRIKQAQAENALEVCRLAKVRRHFEVPAVVPDEPLVSCAEAAQRLGKSPAIVQQAVRQGTVPYVKLPRRRMSEPTYFIPESYLPVWASRGHAPHRSPEVTAQLEVCFLRAKELNRVGV